jgi:protein TonB
MVRIYILTLLLSLSIFVNGQTVDTMETEMVTFIEGAPFFNGDLKEFIQEELIYPLSAKKDTIEGIVVIAFKIDTFGLSINHKIVKGIRGDLNNEALRVARRIKFDKPALQKGKPIEVEYTIPVVFELQYPKRKSKCKRK